MADDKPIIVIKKKGGHGGHHGGAWKVAYADFVTAMMAFFMVMWLVNSAEVQTKQSIASYFRRPGLFAQGSGTPLLIGESGILQDSYAPQKGFPVKNSNIKSPNKVKPDSPPPKDAVDQKRESPSGIAEQKKGKGGAENGKDKPFLSLGTELKDVEGKTTKFADEGGQKDAMEAIAEQIRKMIVASKELKDLLGLVDAKVDAEGLTIEIMDTEKASMFAPGSARVVPEAREAFIKLAGLLNQLPANKIDVIGHTDAKPFSSRNYGYTNWELSSDRANSARKLLEEGGINENRIVGIVGKAATELREVDDPFSPANRRITLKMKFAPNAESGPAKGSSELDRLLGNPLATPAPLGENSVASEPSSSGQSESGAKSDQAVSSESPIASPTIDSTPTPTPIKPLAASGYVPKRKVEAKSHETIKLPDKDPPRDNPSYIPQDKIFGDRPVVGGASPFVGQ